MLAASASAAQQGHPPQNAVDGDRQTRWSAPGLGSFLQLELTCLSTLKELESLWHKGETRASRFEVLTSLDGQTWQLALEAIAPPSEGAVRHALTPPVQARWVRWVNRGNDLNDYISLSELILFGSEDNCERPETTPQGDSRVPLRPYEQPSGEDAEIKAGKLPLGVRPSPSVTRLEATLHSISVEWQIEGDEDHDASASLFYRRSGSTSWKQAPDLVRVDFEYAGWSDTDKAEFFGLLDQNMFAGSAFFLRPDTDYEVMVEMRDPDGGAARAIESIRTRPVPSMIPTRVMWVKPGGGGGAGTREEPWRGLEQALAEANPGDELRLLDGEYGEVEIKDVSAEPGSYIRIVSDTPRGAVFRQIKLIDSDRVWLDSLTFRNPKARQTASKQQSTNS